MKYLIIVMLLLSACANRGVDSEQKKEAKPQVSVTSTSSFQLLDAYQKTSTGGMERADGKHTSTSYSMVFLKSEDVLVDKVYLYGEKRDFEAFDHEGKFYIVIQVFPEAKDNVKGEMIQSANAADVYYTENGSSKVLGVPKFIVKEATIGN